MIAVHVAPPALAQKWADTLRITWRDGSDGSVCALSGGGSSRSPLATILSMVLGSGRGS